MGSAAKPSEVDVDSLVISAKQIESMVTAVENLVSRLADHINPQILHDEKLREARAEAEREAAELENEFLRWKQHQDLLIEEAETHRAQLAAKESGFSVGNRIEVTGLMNDSEFNGRVGEIVQGPISGRFNVDLDGGPRLNIKPSNLAHSTIPHAAAQKATSAPSPSEATARSRVDAGGPELGAELSNMGVLFELEHVSAPFAVVFTLPDTGTQPRLLLRGPESSLSPLENDSGKAYHFTVEPSESRNELLRIRLSACSSIHISVQRVKSGLVARAMIRTRAVELKRVVLKGRVQGLGGSLAADTDFWGLPGAGDVELHGVVEDDEGERMEQIWTLPAPKSSE